MDKRGKMHIFTGGMILIALGVLIILNNTHVFAFTKSWPVLLIVVAIGTLMQRLKDLGGWIILAVGVIFLVLGGLELRLEAMWKYFTPVLLIVFGALILLKARKR